MVDGDRYISRITSVLKQFEMARKAVSDLKDDESRLVPVVQKKAKEHLRSFARILKKADRLRQTSGQDSQRMKAPKVAADEEAVARVIREFEDKARDEFVGEVELACNRVNQNEFIMLIALFEVQIKDIHREILRQEPKLLSPERQVPLGRLISEGFDAILELEIEREVQSLDRKNFEERAAYLQSRLRLAWPDRPCPKAAREVLEIRNRLLHEDADLNITEQQLWDAREVALMLSYHFCLQCAERYPKAFTQWDGYADAAARADELDED